MTPFQLTATWSFATPFHIGTGLSGGGVDRRVRSTEKFQDEEEDDSDALGETFKGERRTIPEISGEALKGSIRGSAERLVRWLIDPEGLAADKDQAETEENSIPRHPALRRIFAWQSLDARHERPAAYRFSAPVYVDGGGLSATASTAIIPDREVAKEKTLRVIQQWSANASFGVTIDGRGGNWDDPQSRDYLDLVLLVAAFTATAQVGGKKGNGLGETEIYGLHLTPMAVPTFDAAVLARLRDSLIAEVRGDA